MVPETLRKKIEEADGKKIDFADYMNEVLYHPEQGYYKKDKEKVGKRGDFITSSNVSNIYGKLFGKLFVRYFRETGLKPAIYEIGAGNGRFARQLLQEIKRLDEKIYQRLQYTIIESSSYHITLQKEQVPEDAFVHYFNSIDEIPENNVEGIIFSNEFFDAFPVHVIQCAEGKLHEVYVKLDNEGRLMKEPSPLYNKEIINYLEKFDISLKEGQQMEIPLAMVTYAKKLANWLSKGSFMTIDYGYRFVDFTRQELHEGSLRGYFQHTMVTNPLDNPYEMDLTSHIHLDSLEAALDEEGYTHICTKRQGEFLLAAGILDYLQENMDPNPFSEKSKQNRAIRTLVMDSGWSNSFQVLLHEKNCNGWDSIIHAQ
jgi:SAM-dependent MidA family methyltransferase